MHRKRQRLPGSCRPPGSRDGGWQRGPCRHAAGETDDALGVLLRSAASHRRRGDASRLALRDCVERRRGREDGRRSRGLQPAFTQHVGVARALERGEPSGGITRCGDGFEPGRAGSASRQHRSTHAGRLAFGSTRAPAAALRRRKPDRSCAPRASAAPWPRAASAPVLAEARGRWFQPTVRQHSSTSGSNDTGASIRSRPLCRSLRRPAHHSWRST